MNGDAQSAPASAPVPGEKEAGSTAGGDSASKFAAMKQRHDAAMEIIKHQHTSVEERYALLEQVVWPSDVLLEMQAEAA